MKSPDRSTRTKLKTDAAKRVAAVLPWGSTPGRQVVEQAGSASAVRTRLKERVVQDHPEGKAMARRQYFGLQRGLPGEDHLGDDAGLASAPTKVQKARAHMAHVAATPAAAPGSAAHFKAAANAALPVWRELGPTLIPHGQTYGSGPGASPSVSGRCSGVVVDRTDSRHLIACSAGGGLWGSLDTGATWAPLTDRAPTLVMGAITQSPSAPGVVYAATGDGDGQIPFGVGLLRSTDAGLTWQAVLTPNLSGVGVYDLAVDPGNALRVWIASDQALLLSTNGGQTARSVIAAPCWSISIHPTQASELLAAFADGLARSNDGGATWARVVLPGTSSATRFKRLEVAHAPGQGGVVWLAGCIGRQAVLWRRASVGGAFTAMNVPASMKTSQAWYDWCLAVAPDDPDLIFWGAIDLFRGKRGASTMAWQNVSSRSSGDSIHPDQHFVAFDAKVPGVLYACNDGGLFRSADRGEHWTSLNPGLGITEFEYLAQLQGNANWLFGGTQDNGSLTLAGPRRWDQVALGDGGDCAAVDRGAASIVYHSYYDMPIERAPALGANAFSWSDVTPPVPDGYEALFYPPLEARGSVLVKAGVSVWISANDGNDWNELSLPGASELITALAIVGDHTVLAGTQSGQMWRIARGSGSSGSWANASVSALAALAGGFVSDIAVVGSTGKTLWVTCSQLGGGHVFRSLNAGKTFSDRSGNLPDMAVSALVVDPKTTSTVYVATDRGVWRSKNSGTGWAEFNNGLPNVIAGDLMLHESAHRLRVGTRSRGAWEVSL